MRRWLLAFLLLSSLPMAHGQVWQRDAVLSSIQVKRLAFGPTGFTWVGTDAGVFRYDGNTLTPLDALVRNGEQMPAGETYALVVDETGKVWCGSTVGLYCFEPTTGNLRHIVLPKRPEETRKVWWLWARPGNDHLWVSYGKDALVLLNTRHTNRVPRQPLTRLGGNEVEWIGPAADGCIWAVTQDHGVYLIDVDGRVRWNHRQPRTSLMPLNVAPLQRLVSGRALYDVLPGGGVRERLRWLPPGVEDTFKPVLTDSTMQWVADSRLITLAWRANAPPRVTRQPAPPGLTVDITLQQSPDGVLWCYRPFERGCYKARPVGELVRPLPLAGGGEFSTRAIHRLPDGRLLAGTYSGSLTQAADSPAAPLRHWRVWVKGEPSSHTPVPYDLLVTRKGQVVVADEVGSVGELNPATGELRYYRLLTPPPNRGPNAFSLITDSAGGGWAGTHLGLYRVDFDRREMARYHDTDSAFTLNRLKLEQIIEAPAGVLWAATAEGLFRLQVATGRLVRYGAGETGPQRLPTNMILTIHAASPDSLWLGTRDAGLLLLHPARGVVRQVTTRQGLPSMSVASLLPAPRTGELWIGTFAGLVRYSPRSGQMAVLTKADGLPSTELNRQSAWREPVTGLLYFGSVGGISQLNTSKPFSPQPRPRLLVSAVTQHFNEGDTVRTTLLAGTAPMAGIRLGPYDAFAELDLALSDYLNPEGARYSYRLLGSGDERFHSLNGPHLRLQNLRPGDYTVEVRAETSLGLPALNHVQFPLEVVAVWWQRPGVWVLAALALVGLVYSWQRRRIAQLQHEQQLRSRIAADLHDEVGALLTRVNLQAEVLNETGATPHQLGELLEDSRAAVATMRDVVWSIDAHADTVGALLDRMRDHLERSVEPAGWHFNLRVENLADTDTLAPQVRQHLYLIFKEAITNALRHAQNATTLQIYLAREGRRLILDVHDDGQPHPGPATRSGLGLRSMRQRAAALRGFLEVGPVVGGGYRVRCEVGGEKSGVRGG